MLGKVLINYNIDTARLVHYIPGFVLQPLEITQIKSWFHADIFSLCALNLQADHYMLPGASPSHWIK